MSELTAMMNIGKEMARKLTSVGIDTPEKLIELGSIKAFRKLKEVYPNVCLVHLYTLEGAIYSTEYNRLSEGKKKELKAFSDYLKGADND
ncbi:MAG: TfoX/Sxy family DNA transformation protein [Oscillospiraceae bacterium]|nr:TfoX/Sxy family DNA transformation protein [Oscillospiraceae bacterium]